jgi:hypothetical protein
MIMMPFAEGQKKRRMANWAYTECVPGMTWQNGGSLTFLFNFMVDLVPGIGERIPMFDGYEPSLHEMLIMEETIKMFQLVYERDFVYYVLDLSRQDSSVSAILMEEYFRYARSAFEVRRGKDQARFGRWAQWCADWMINTRIALPDGQVWQKHGGNVSGSPFTTELNTYTALLGARGVFGAILGRGSQSLIKARVYGDNILVAIPRDKARGVDLELVGRVWMDMYGQKINPDESYVTSALVHRVGMVHEESVSFLGKHVMSNGGVWRPTADTVSSLVAPDGEVDDNGINLSRCIGLLIDNPFNAEAVAIVTEYMDRLERQGFVPTGLAKRERVKNLFKIGLYGESIFFERMSVEQAQFLYLFTSHQRTQLGLGAGTWVNEEGVWESSQTDLYLGSLEQSIERMIAIGEVLVPL